jgi:hypothetical protein
MIMNESWTIEVDLKWYVEEEDVKVGEKIKLCKTEELYSVFR